MPLPDFPPVIVQAPARAGVGLRFRERTADPSWPVDWWQRNYDTLCEDDPDPAPFCERALRLPEPPHEH
jgi:hypothetical protein